VHKAKYVAAIDQLEDVVMPARERALRTERLFAAAVLAQAAAAAHACAAVGLPADLPLVINGWEWAVNPATGRVERVCRATVATTPAQLTGLGLAHVDPVACLRGLRGQVSEDRLVQPVAQRSARRTEADTRLNLTAMDPFAFEQLIADLAEAMGYSAERTTRSRDGGVDVYVRSNGPMMAGTIVISAKRYTRTVDVHYVRELLGVVNHEGAMGGILITTSGFGPSAYQWAQGKPLQLVDGQQLREWLATHLNIDAN
jgi:restriction system protein